MAELGLAASVIGVIQLAGSCLKLSRKWVGPSEFCSTDLTALTTAIYNFDGVLGAFQTHLEIHEDDEARLNTLEYLKPILTCCKESLEIVETFIKNDGFIGKHLVGAKFDRKLKVSLNVLDRAKEIFMLALHADQHTIIRGVEQYTRIVAEDLRDVRNELTTGIKGLHEGGDKVYHEVKKAITEQQRWQDAAGETTLHIKAAVDRQDARGYSEERRVILNWLTTIDYTNQQHDYIRRRHSGTGEWFLNLKEFKTWRDIGKQTLFCLGIPGAGKTILTSLVVHHLCNRFYNDTTTGIAFLYCNFRREEEQKAEHLLANLLKQLSQGLSPLPATLKELYDRHQTRGTRPLLDEISNALQSVVRMYARVFIIIDALDECQETDGDRTSLLAEVFSLRNKSGINLFATARPVPEIEEKFKDCPSLEIRAKEEDIWNYLGTHMSQLPEFVKGNEALQTEIKTSIGRSIDGMFLLAQLYLDSLVGKRSPAALRRALEDLSVTSRNGQSLLYDAYEKAMERIKCQKGDLPRDALLILSWIVYAKRPLTASELQHALAVEPGKLLLDKDNIPSVDHIVNACAPLITIDEESNIVRLAHYTLQEYFERPQKAWFPNAGAEIANICVTYLSFENFGTGYCPTDEEFKSRLESNALYNYAVRYWDKYVDAAVFPEGYSSPGRVFERESKESALHRIPKVVDDHNFEDLALKLFQDEQKISSISQALFVSPWRYSGYSQDFPKNFQGLHYATYLGLKTVVKLLLAAGVDADSKDTYGRTPLSWAAKKGHEAVVKVLLDKGVEPDSRGTDGRTPLSQAAGNGHEAVVKLLLAAKADANSRDTYGQTLLFWAAGNSHETVVKLLLAAKADANSKDTYSRTPLSRAAQNGHEAVVKLLLAAGVEPDSKDTYSRTPLFEAAENGHEAVVKLLLDVCDHETQRDDIGRTLLSVAARKGHQHIVTLLLATESIKPQLEANDYYGLTALSVAAGNSHIDIVKLLLNTERFDLDSRDHFGRSVLWWAKRAGNVTIEKLVLQSAEQKGISLSDNYIPTAGSTPSSTVESSYCDVCTLTIQNDNFVAGCTVCLGGTFVLCSECYKIGAHCLENSHILIQL